MDEGDLDQFGVAEDGDDVGVSVQLKFSRGLGPSSAVGLRSHSDFKPVRLKYMSS